MRSVVQTVIPALLTVLPAGELIIAQNPETLKVRNIVLVQGAFAAGSSWSKVVPLLQARGFHVTSIQIPLTSFADDVAATKRVIAIQDGPMILVGHSYGGVVITEAGNDPKVVGLVYAAAFAPDQGQTIVDISKDFPKPPGLDELKPQPGGFLLLTDAGMKNDFAQDLSEVEKSMMLAEQPLTSGSIFDAKITRAAWHNKPTWYVVAENDSMIAPGQERTMAKTMNAKTNIASVEPRRHAVFSKGSSHRD